MFLREVRSKSIEIDFDISFKSYSTNIIEWLKPIIDLKGWYVYPTNGITEGLNFWMSIEKRNIHVENGDYEWVENTGTNGIYYITCPSSKDGNFREIPTDVPVALDIAYVGSTPVQKIPVTDNIEYVFYSLSKPFGLNTVRTGWMFTRRPNVKMHKLTRAKYYNHIAHSIAESTISKFSIDYIYNKYCDEQKRVCKEHNLIPSDCVWIGTSTNEEYKRYWRDDKARICLSELYT